ncbi:tRNA-specific adenosine-34 deaminase [Mesoplasma florum W37]|uniref:tRNA-specific adenosine-34 deaminase n=1 Tax=Mesoplasma florum TaxID=2151 RepID=A0AAD0HTV8_MESFO|nr:deaminase [Mesoplasma florum]AGY41796.1 tRNA-specific adenosine-34 deaminase [Mesoplasma florum W37]AVN59995.1 tRNA-specific adenosine deaminase [Mesoplasma florum]AVN66135.1 tRNA-specific adenosine-34 deaminase [Mesoplasma florum]
MKNLNTYINKIKVKNKSKDIPVFSCLIKDNKIVFKSKNNSYKIKKITGHAEINVMNKAFKKIKNGNLSEYILFTTLEPCLMCYGAIKQAKIKEIIYLTENVKLSFRNDVNIDQIKVNIRKLDHEELQSKYQKIISDFFQKKR